MRIPWRRPSVTVALIWVFLPLVSGTGLLVAWLESRRTSQLLTDASEATLQAMVSDLRASWARQVDPRFVVMDLELLAEAAQAGNYRWRSTLPHLRDALRLTPNVAAYLVGLRDGSYLRVARLPNVNGGLLVQGLNLADGSADPFHEAFDAGLKPRPVPAALASSPAYDPRTRPWYQLATASPGQTVISPVQRLAFTGAMGVTLSRSLDGGAGAVAASVRLDTLTQIGRAHV